MKLINFKKLFCIMLSTSIILPSGVNAQTVGQKEQSKWNSENAKKIAKKVAPYVAGIGIPAVVAIVVGSVLLAKKSSNSTSKTSGNGDTKNNEGIIIDKNGGSDGIPTGTQTNAPFTREFIDSCIDKGYLPGIKFYVIKNQVFKNYLFYKITDGVAARKYLNFVKTGNKEKVSDWEMYVIYQDDAMRPGGKNVSAIFGKDTELASDINKVVEKIMGDVASFECKNYTIKKDESKGGREKVTITGEEAPSEQKGSDGLPKSGASTEKNLKPTSGQSLTEKLAHDIAGSDGSVGGGAANQVEQKVQQNIDDAMSKGELPGFQFYRCRSALSTYHCYIVTDKDKAKQTLGITDENDESWKKVLCYQNRWLYKNFMLSKWSFGKIFKLDDGFGRKFDIITHEKDAQSREGTTTFEEWTTKYKEAYIGSNVFARSDKQLKNFPFANDDVLMSVITTEKFDKPEDVRSAYK